MHVFAPYLLFAIHLQKLRFEYDTSQELKSIKYYKIEINKTSYMYSGIKTYLHYIQ